jgi:hypothetical protein
MLKRNVRIEEDLVDQLFNSSEKRLARALLLIARYPNIVSPSSIQSLLQGCSIVALYQNTFCLVTDTLRRCVQAPRNQDIEKFFRVTKVRSE